MALDLVYIQTDNVLEVLGLQNAVTLAYLNTATVQVTLQDLSGANVAPETWPVTLSYVAASNGNYRGTLSKDLVLSRDKTYRGIITANAGAGLYRTWYCNLRAVESVC